MLKRGGGIQCDPLAGKQIPHIDRSCLRHDYLPTTIVDICQAVRDKAVCLNNASVSQMQPAHIPKTCLCKVPRLPSLPTDPLRRRSRGTICETTSPGSTQREASPSHSIRPRSLMQHSSPRQRSLQAPSTKTRSVTRTSGFGPSGAAMCGTRWATSGSTRSTTTTPPVTTTPSGARQYGRSPRS